MVGSIVRPLAHSIARKAAATVMATESHRKQAADLGQAGQEKTRIIPFGIDEIRARRAIADAHRTSVRRSRHPWASDLPLDLQVEGIYLAFWVFDGFVETRLWGRMVWQEQGGDDHDQRHGHQPNEASGVDGQHVIESRRQRPLSEE